MAVVVVPESRITTWPSFTWAAADCRNPQLLLAVKLFLFPQRGIFQRAFAGRQCAAVGAMHQPMGVQNFQIFSDRDLGSVEFPGHVRDQHPAIALQDLDNGPPAFFVEHVSSGMSESWNQQAYDCAFFLYRLLSFVQCNVNGISPVDEDNPAGVHLAGLFTEPFVTLNL